MAPLQRVDHRNVRPLPRRDQPAVLQPEGLRRRQRGRAPPPRSAAGRPGAGRRALAGGASPARYLLALQQQQGLSLDRAETALRTACLTGVATAKLAPGVDTPGGHTLKLAAGDLDEAVAGLLANGLVASDTNGDTIAAGFSRIAAFRAGALGDQGLCLRRYQ